ncbi:hypothetical protein HYZ41_01160 [archaeon]|nr:hypothetical protein [archaeon]
MKGSIEFSQGAVLYIILMLLVIFIGLMIVTKGQLLLVFEQDSLSKMFGPSQFQMTTTVNGKEQSLSEKNVQIECINWNLNWNLKINNVGFRYTGGGKDNLKFIVVLDLNKVMRVGHDISSNFLFTCTKQGEGTSAKYECGESKEIIFDSVQAGGVLHFTAWKDDENAEIANKIAPNPDYTFGDLVDEYSQNYMGSYDLSGLTAFEACLGDICKKIKDGDACMNTKIKNNDNNDIGCWFQSGNCYACKTVTKCGDFKSSAECKQCSTYNNLNCGWISNQCKNG